MVRAEMYCCLLPTASRNYCTYMSEGDQCTPFWNPCNILELSHMCALFRTGEPDEHEAAMVGVRQGQGGHGASKASVPGEQGHETGEGGRDQAPEGAARVRASSSPFDILQQILDSPQLFSWTQCLNMVCYPLKVDSADLQLLLSWQLLIRLGCLLREHWQETTFDFGPRFHLSSARWW